jgi:hypothetical protein
MTVAPRYAAYADAADTGLDAPVELPRGLPAAPRAPAAAQATRAASAESLQPGRAAAAPRAAAGSSGQLLGAEAEANGGAAGRAPASGAPGSRGDGACARPAAELLRASARLYLACQGGVERVFVGHPLFDAADGDIYGAAAAATYLEGDALPDLDLRYSVLCQARRLLPSGSPLARCQPSRSRAAVRSPDVAGLGVQHCRWAAAGRAARPGWLPKSGLTRCQALVSVREREGRRVLTPRSDM